MNEMNAAWEAAIPETRRFSRIFSDRYPQLTADDLEQEILLQFPDIWERIGGSHNYQWEFRQAMQRCCYRALSKRDRLGVGLGETQRTRLGHMDGGSFDEHFSEVDDDGYGGEPELKTPRAQRVDNHNCCWCGEWFALKLNHQPYSPYCSIKCGQNGRLLKRQAVYFRPILERLRAGEVQVAEMRRMAPKWMAVVRGLQKLGYQIETNVTAGACKTGYFRLVKEGVCLPKCA